MLIPVRIRSTGVELLYGGPLPELADGTVGDLIVPAFAFRDTETLQQFVGELSGPVLKKGTRLLVSVPAAESARKGLVSSESLGCPTNAIGPFVEVVLAEPLELTLRGTKRAALRSCTCQIPALKRTATSVNHAYTIISEHFERDRRSHTGNVFEKVLYETDCKPEGRCWLPLDALRRPREAAIAKRVRAVARRGAREA